MPLRHILLALIVVAIWGFNFVVIKFSVTALPPITAAALRFVFASWPLLLFVKRPRASWGWIALYGLAFGFCLYTYLNFAIAIGMPAGLASVVLQVQAFFTMAIAFVVLGERPSRKQLAGAAVAFTGIGVIAFARLDGASFLPFLVTLFAAVSWGAANVTVKMVKEFDVISTTVWSAFFGSLALLALAVVSEGPGDLIAFFTEPEPFTLAVIAFLAYPSTLFGMAVWNYLLNRYPAGLVAPFTLLVPITGVVSGWLVFGEVITPYEMAGGALVVAGIGISVFRKRRKTALAPA